MLSILIPKYRSLRYSFNLSHDKSHDDFNVFCVDNYYDHPTYGKHEVSAAEIGLNTSLKVWAYYMLSPEGTSCFLRGTQIYVTVPTPWPGRSGIIMLVPNTVTRKTFLPLPLSPI